MLNVGITVNMGEEVNVYISFSDALKMSGRVPKKLLPLVTYWGGRNGALTMYLMFRFLNHMNVSYSKKLKKMFLTLKKKLILKYMLKS